MALLITDEDCTLAQFDLAALTICTSATLSAPKNARNASATSTSRNVCRCVR